MEPKFQTSFIPKENLGGRDKKVNKKRVDLLFLLALIIFLSVALLSVGVFFYDKLVESNIDKKSAQLERAKGAFDPDLIGELSRLSKKLSISEDLLSKHVSLSSVFDNIEESTLKSIRFSDFSYALEGNDINISMKGKAGSFGSIALQSDIFGRDGVIENPVFSNLNLDSFGDVSFQFTAKVNANKILYKDTLSSQ